MDDPALDEQVSFAARRPRRRVWPVVFAVALAAFVLGLGATALTMRFYAQWTGAAVQTAPTAAAPRTTAQSAAQFMPSAPLSATGARTADLESLQGRELALTGRIAELEARLATTSTAAQAASGNATRAEGLMIAFAARRALDRGLGLGYIEGQLRDRFGPVQPQAVATVIAAARQPVTLEDLREGIEAISPQLRTGNTTDGWWSSLRREVSDLVVIRKAAAPSPRAEDRLIRARRMLDAGQVEGALAEVGRLPGADAGDRWIAAANRYIGARQALDTIESAAILGQGRDPFAPAPAGAARAAPAAADPVTGALLAQ